MPTHRLIRHSSTRRVTLNPKPGFVVKTTLLASGMYTTKLGQPPLSPSDEKTSSTPTTVAVYKGYKIFLNVCWDPNVPAPPERTEDQIRRAMLGADPDGGGYYVPVVVSDGRPVNDKGKSQSLAFFSVHVVISPVSWKAVSCL